MTAPEIIVWATVIAVGFFAAGRNPTALALVIAWFAGEIFYLRTGNNMPVAFYLFPDIFVIACIAAKAERSLAERIVLLIFPVMWGLYVAPVSDFTRWWSLTFLVLAQFLVVGAETFSRFLRGADASNRPPDLPGALLVMCREGRGYG